MPDSTTGPDDLLIGSKAGVYRLVRRLGEGGMGAVYLAEREEDFTRQVAIKLLLNGAHRETAVRFQIEKETLAALLHPNIVGLLDAGVTAAGIPYLAMEYVEGEPLDRYCAALGIGTRHKLELIAAMLDAIEFAHQRLVAHCDLKFSNVLVTHEGAVRLLDFGIAKLLNPSRYGFADSFTRQFRPLTPEFASPEQLTGAPLTVATDLYSAGVLLYELLTGEHPFEDKLLQPVSMLEAVCHTEPERPSRRATRLGNAATARELTGDIDAIVLQALRKDPAHRYRSASAMAADLRGYLSGMPVQARTGATWYRAGKFVRRNRGISAAIAVSILVAVSGVAGTFWEGVRADRAKAVAQVRAGDIRRLSNSLITDLYERVGRLPGSLGAQQMLVSRAVAYLDRLAAGNRGDGALLLELAQGYVRLAGVQGSPYENNLGKPQDGLATLDKALALIHEADAAKHGAAEPKLVLARARQMRGDILAGMGKSGEALADARQAATLADEALHTKSTDIEVLLQSASAHESVGDKLWSAGLANAMDTEGASRELERARVLDQEVLRLRPNEARARRGIALLTSKLADVKWASDPAAGLAGYREAQSEFQKLAPAEQETLPNRRLRAGIARRIGEGLAGEGRFDEAAGVMEENIQVLDSMLAVDPGNGRTRWDLAVAERAMANLEDARGRTQDALRHHEKTAGLLRQMPDAAISLQTQTALGESLVEAGSIRSELGDRAGAFAATREGLDLLRRVAQNPQVSAHALASIAESFLTSLPAELQDPAFAYRCLQPLGDAPEDPAAQMLLAEAHRRLGREKEAVAVARALLERLPKPAPGQPPDGIRQRAENFLRR